MWGSGKLSCPCTQLVTRPSRPPVKWRYSSARYQTDVRDEVKAPTDLPLIKNLYHLDRSRHGSRAAESGFGPQRKIFFGSSNKGVPARNLHFISERPTYSCGVTWASSQRVNLYSMQIMILQRQKYMQHCRAPGPLPYCLAPGNLFRIPTHLSSAMTGPQIRSRAWGSEKFLSVRNRTTIPKTPTHSLTV